MDLKTNAMPVPTESGAEGTKAFDWIKYAKYAAIIVAIYLIYKMLTKKKVGTRRRRTSPRFARYRQRFSRFRSRFKRRY